MEQAAEAYEGDPLEFIRELTAWVAEEGNDEIQNRIAQEFANRFRDSQTYLKLLYSLLDGLEKPEQRKTVQLFIDAYQTHSQ